MSEAVMLSQLEQLKKQLAEKACQLDLMTSLASLANEPGSIEHVVRRSLEIISRANNCVLGQFWIVRSDDNVVTCTDWYHSTFSLPDFRQASLDRRLSKGVGLGGRVWSTGLPIFIPDLNTEKGLDFTRKSVAIKSGIKSGFAFPLKNGPFITAVCEFFSFESLDTRDSQGLFYEKLGIYLATVIAQREADYALRQQESLNKIVLNHAYNAFIAINEASLITEWTSRATDLFGWDKEEVVGKPLAEIIIPERYREAHMKGLFRYMTTKEGPVLNKPIRAPALKKDGTEIPVELLIFPIEALDMKRFGAFIVDCSRPEMEATIRLD